MQKLRDQLVRVRRAGVPIVAIQSADQQAVVEDIVAVMSPDKIGATVLPNEGPAARPIVSWDIVRGFVPLNTSAKQAIKIMCGQQAADSFNSPVDALKASVAMPGGASPATLIMMLANRYMEEPTFVQAVMNVRDVFKTDGRRLVMLGSMFKLAPELQWSVPVLDDELPDDEAIGGILDRLCKENEIQADKPILTTATAAFRGLPNFAVEQAGAMSTLAVDGHWEFERKTLWERKRQAISQVRGLKMLDPVETFDDVGGIEQVKKFHRQLFAGPRAYNVIVFMDEIEKSFGGAGTSGLGDSSGTSQDALGVVLNRMESDKYSGMLAFGPPGSAKTFFALTLAATVKRPLMVLDLGAAKGSLVGQSEQQIRAAMNAIRAVAGEGGAYFVGTCNRLNTLPPELKRRFRFGLWFFDLPDADERAVIGKIHTTKLNLPYDEAFWRARDGWSGANVRDLCELAFAMQIKLEEAMAYIVPAAQQDPDGLAQSRDLALGRFLSASYPGVYKGEAESMITTNRSRRLDSNEIGN